MNVSGVPHLVNRIHRGLAVTNLFQDLPVWGRYPVGPFRDRTAAEWADF